MKTNKLVTMLVVLIGLWAGAASAIGTTGLSVSPDGVKTWFMNGKVVRTESSNGVKAWFVNGKPVSEEEYNKFMNNRPTSIEELYMEKIRNKIRQYVNPQLCGSGKPEMLLAVHLLPTGEVSGTPRITKSSGISACDESVERALLQAQPLPVPSEAELFNEFRSLNFKFRPLE